MNKKQLKKLKQEIRECLEFNENGVPYEVRDAERLMELLR